MVTPQQIREFRNSLNEAHSNLNFGQFCKACGFQTDKYGESQWFAFKTLCQYLAHFDDTTLAKLLNAKGESR